MPKKRPMAASVPLRKGRGHSGARKGAQTNSSRRLDGFRGAMAMKTPVVAAVSPHFLDEWAEFAGHVAEFVEPTPEALEDWWARLRAG